MAQVGDPRAERTAGRIIHPNASADRQILRTAGSFDGRDPLVNPNANRRVREGSLPPASRTGDEWSQAPLLLRAPTLASDFAKLFAFRSNFASFADSPKFPHDLPATSPTGIAVMVARLPPYCRSPSVPRPVTGFPSINPPSDASSVAWMVRLRAWQNLPCRFPGLHPRTRLPTLMLP